MTLDVVAQVSKEGDVYEVPMSVAKMSTLVATTIDDDAEEDDEVREIPLPNVKDAVLTKVIEYCTHYKEEPMTPIQTPLKSSKIEDLVQPWYAEFVKVEQVLLFELVTAANFMDIKPLLDLTCLAVSILIKVRIIACTKSCGCWVLEISHLSFFTLSMTII
jgi:S-phase kinase-associated protein 1